MISSKHSLDQVEPIPGVRIAVRLRSFVACRRGMASVEMGFVLLPLLMLLLGAFQFVVFQYTQITLNSALYDTASVPETEVKSLVPSQSGYKDKICLKVMSTGTYCKDNILVEMRPLEISPTSKTPITGLIFEGGVPGTPMLLRAAMPVIQFVPFIPKMVAKSSVVFVR